jgi:DNA (cytosine-5)-methyltransferase 1
MNGVFPTIQYYLRLISLKKFMNDYSELINLDQELNLIHKEKWNQIIEKLNNDQ